jgi:hypothetical protein
MKKIAISIILVFAILSCNHNHDNSIDGKKETPKALQDKKIDLGDISKRYNDNLVNELYHGQVSERKDLKDLESLIENTNTKKDDVIELFLSFKSKNDDYYNAATNYIQTISDTILRARLNSIIKASSDKYKGRTKNIETMIQQIESRNMSINDYHIAMKLIVTLPLIEDFQKSNIPQDSIFTELYREQGVLLNKIDKMTKK